MGRHGVGDAPRNAGTGSAEFPEGIPKFTTAGPDGASLVCTTTIVQWSREPSGCLPKGNIANWQPSDRSCEGWQPHTNWQPSDRIYEGWQPSEDDDFKCDATVAGRAAAARGGMGLPPHSIAHHSVPGTSSSVSRCADGIAAPCPITDSTGFLLATATCPRNSCR